MIFMNIHDIQEWQIPRWGDETLRSAVEAPNAQAAFTALQKMGRWEESKETPYFTTGTADVQPHKNTFEF